MKTQLKNNLRNLLIVTTVLLFSTVSVMAKKNIDVATEDRQLPAFTSIKLMCSADLIIQQGNTQKVTVKADSDILQYLETSVEGDVLVVDVSKNRLHNIHVLELYITIPSLEKLMSLGSGDVELKDNFKANDLYVKLNGSGDFRAHLQVTNLKLEINGSGDAEFEGVKGNFNLSIRGSGDVEGSRLQLETCTLKSMGSGDVELSGNCVDLTTSQMGSGDVNAYALKAVNVIATSMGSGDVLISVVESLAVKLSGSGDLTYSGNPEKVKVTANGSGDVYHR